MTQLSWAELYDLCCRHGARPGADLCACAAADAESGRDPAAIGDNGHSFGLWQMYDQGLGAGMTPEQRADPAQAAAVMVPLFNQTYTDGLKAGYSGEELVRYCTIFTERPAGWPDLHSSAADRYVAAWRAAVAALGSPDTPDLHYDPDVPAERQTQSWTCSIRTAAWLLHSLGDPIPAADLEDLMVPGLVTPALGLLQGDGSGLAAFLAAQTGLPAGYQWCDWAWLQAHAGTMPIGLGSSTLYHWVAVRQVLDDDTLALANPAPGYRGLGDTMTAAQFAQWAPWAAVYIPVPTGGDDLSAEERAELERLRSEVSSYENDTFTPLAATMDALLAHPPAKAELLAQIAAMRNSIRTNVGL